MFGGDFGAGVEEVKAVRRIEIRVIDNGSGFDTGLLKEVSHSVGLQNIRERLVIFDPRGTFDIQSEKGKGTVVCISLKRK